MENIRKFIIDHSDFTDYIFDDCKYSNLEDIKEGAGLEIFPQIANGIYTIFKNTYLNNDYRFKRGTHSIQELFSDYCAGLPGVLDTCYYYRYDPIDIIADILEMTPGEKETYSIKHQDDIKNCQYLDYLIYREIIKAANK